ncbi:tetratricopeptide repeat protein 13-like [Stylophora pistillata]|uniref:tetratricopeptide repeat protein 13-like n=1 Tax=Stylophora pistillata TaxID=50429 RepID=UPI000C03DE9E|nr:tetratricopeptide repeat protein 13-like [Stylophora pistillata]
MTVWASAQSATFSMCGQLYHGHDNTTALSSSPVVRALGSELDNLGSSPGWGVMFVYSKEQHESWHLGMEGGVYRFKFVFLNRAKCIGFFFFWYVCLENGYFILQEHPWVTAAYFGRGTAYVQKGLQHKENAEAAIEDFSTIIRLTPDDPEGWIKRAEVFSPLGNIRGALADIKVALDLKPSSQLYIMSGTLLFMQEDYEAASKSFEKCLEIEKNQPTAMLYNGLSLYHRGRVEESIEIFKVVLQTNTNQAECHRSLGHAYREIGEPELSHEHFTSAIKMEPTVAQNYHSRGILNYMRGWPDKAVSDLEACLKYNPGSVSCKYWKGVSHAALGNFFESVKSSTQILLDEASSSPLQNIDVIKSYYLKGEYYYYYYYFICLLLSGFSVIPVFECPLILVSFLCQMCLSLILFFINREVENVSFGDFSPDAQLLLCKSSVLGPLVQYNSNGFLPSSRHHRAMGLAMLDVAQVVTKYWRAGRSSKTNQKKASWRDMFDVVVKWRRLSDAEQPVYWLDLMPEKSVKTGFNFRMNLLRGQLKSVRYSDYFDKIFQFTKTMLQHLYRVDEFNKTDFKRKIEKAKNCRELIQVLKQHDTRNPQPGMILSTHVTSSKGGGKKSLEGLNLSLSESGTNILFTMDTPTTPARTASYHSELDYIWGQLNDELRKPGNKDIDVIGNYILSLVYYFFNLMPLSRGSSAVAYTVALGLFLAVGRETTGKIPPGKEVDLEAMIGGSVENFIKNVKGWLGLKKFSKPVTSLPLVSEVFPTLRTVLEALNAQFTDANCKDIKSYF